MITFSDTSGGVFGLSGFGSHGPVEAAEPTDRSERPRGEVVQACRMLERIPGYIFGPFDLPAEDRPERRPDRGQRRPVGDPEAAESAENVADIGLTGDFRQKTAAGAE